MRTSTRLILTLMIAVGTIMGVTGYIVVRSQESALMAHRRSEVLAHAITLQIALNELYRAGQHDRAKTLIDRLSENPKILGVILYDEQGQVSVRSSPNVVTGTASLTTASRVVESGETFERSRRIEDDDYISVSMPIDIGGGRRAAFEIVEVTSYVKEDIREARMNIVAATLVLFLAISVVVVFVTRRNLSRPIAELLAGARAIGQGDHDHRVVIPHGGAEFNDLASEFNRMAERLVDQRRTAVRESEERLALERDMRHNERLALVGRLAAGIAHEMGAPLNVIDGRAAQLLSQPTASIERRQRNLTIIRSQTQRIARIVRQLLGLARPYVLQPSVVDLGRLARSACDLIEPDAAATGVKVDISASDDVFVEVDEQLLQQVFLNLCLNGIQAMTDGGRLHVDVSSDSQRAVVHITDTGPGIRPEHLPHVFEPFFTTKEVGFGTGLGLSVSRRIIEEHGGLIEAANGPSGGAAFTIHLALAAAPMDLFAEEGKTIGSTATGR